MGKKRYLKMICTMAAALMCAGLGYNHKWEVRAAETTIESGRGKRRPCNIPGRVPCKGSGRKRRGIQMHST